MVEEKISVEDQKEINKLAEDVAKVCSLKGTHILTIPLDQKSKAIL